MSTLKIYCISYSLVSILVTIGVLTVVASPAVQDLAQIGNCRITLAQGDINDIDLGKTNGGVIVDATSVAHAIVNDGQSDDDLIKEVRDAFVQKYSRPFAAGDAFLVDASGLGLGRGVSFLLHVVGPQRNIEQDPQSWQSLLYRSYHNVLQVIEDKHASQLIGAVSRIVLFPPISTGEFGYPIQEATSVAFASIRKWLEEHQNTKLTEVRFVVQDVEALQCYQDNARVLNMTDEEFNAHMWELEGVGTQQKNTSTHLLNKSLLTPRTMMAGAVAFGLIAGTAAVLGRTATSADDEAVVDLDIEQDEKEEQLVF